MTVGTVQAGAVLEMVTLARYQEAVLSLGAAWPGLAVEPGECAPDLLFSIGVLNTNLGLTHQEPRAHEVAKNCLSRASRGLKGDSRDLCDIQLALTYWRSGDEEEALIQLNEITQRPLTDANLFRGLLATAIVLGSLGRYREELETLSRAQPVLDSVSVAFRGRFHSELALTLRRIGGDCHDRCLSEYTAALVYFEECQAETLEASVRNNLARVYTELGNFDEAHRHVEKAIEIGSRLGDKGRVAQYHDEQARIFLTQNQPVRAARCAHESVRLIQGTAPGWAIDSRITYAKALARVGDSRSLDEFSMAIQTARRQENRAKETEAALVALEELNPNVSLMMEWFPLAERSDERKRVNAVRRKLAEKLAALSDYEDVKIALAENKGNITHAAKSLGYSHHTGLLAYLKHHPELRLKKQYKRSKR